MSNSSLDPKALLLALSHGAPPPDGISLADWERARGVLERPTAASAEALVGLPEPLAVAILEGAVQARSVELPLALAERKGSLGKEAKRALYRLKSLGISVAAAAPIEQATVPQTESTGEVWPCLISPVLGNGERALAIPRSVPGGVQTFELTFSDEQGVLHVSSSDVGRGALRKELKRLREEVQRGARRAVVEITLEEAKFILAEAAGRNVAASMPPPSGTEVVLRKLELVPNVQPPPLPAPELHDASLAQQGATLHDEPELRPWLPPETEIRQFAQAIDTLAHSPIQLSQNQRAEGLLQRVQAMTENFFSPPMQQLYARRLWQMGRYFELSERPRAAEIARAEARRLFHAASPSASPFARRLFEKVLSLTAEAASAEPKPDPKPEAAKTSSLILTP